MGRTIKLGRLSGISIEIDLSWFIIFALVAASFATNYFADYVPAGAPALMWAFGIAGALLLFASIVAHELCHAYAARRYGVGTSSVTLFVFGGVARLTGDAPSPKAEFWIGVAGPLCSFALSAFFLALLKWAEVLGAGDAYQLVLALAGLLNAFLGLFNLLPGAPLDGGHVVRALAWWRSGSAAAGTRVATSTGQVVGFGMMALGVFIAFAGPRLNLGGLWYVLIGWFIVQAAASQRRAVQAQQTLSGVPAAQLMSAPVKTVSAEISVEDLVRDHFMTHAHDNYPVMEGETVIGVINVAAVRGIPREQWATTLVRGITPPLAADQVMSPEADGWEALARMARNEYGCVLIVDQGRLAGILTHSDVLRLMRARLELGV